MAIEIPVQAVPGQPLAPEYDSATQGTASAISNARKYVPGPGTRRTEVVLDNGATLAVVTATTAGKTQTRSLRSEESNGMKIDVFEVSVAPKNVRNGGAIFPRENDIVLVRVTRTTAKQANVEILSIEGRGPVLADSGAGSNGGLVSTHGQILANNSNSGSTVAPLIFMSTVGATNALLQAHPADLGENFKGIIRVQDIRATEKDKVKINESFRPGDIVRAEVINVGDGANYYLSTAKNELGVVLCRANNGVGELMWGLDYETVVGRSGGMELRRVARPFV